MACAHSVIRKVNCRPFSTLDCRLMAYWVDSCPFPGAIGGGKLNWGGWTGRCCGVKCWTGNCGGAACCGVCSAPFCGALFPWNVPLGGPWYLCFGPWRFLSGQFLTIWSGEEQRKQHLLFLFPGRLFEVSSQPAICCARDKLSSFSSRASSFFRIPVTIGSVFWGSVLWSRLLKLFVLRSCPTSPRIASYLSMTSTACWTDWQSWSTQRHFISTGINLYNWLRANVSCAIESRFR